MFIVYLTDSNDCMITFERFSCKKIETVKRNMYKLLSNDLYRTCNKSAVKMAIYSSADGYNKSAAPVLSMDI